MFGWSRSSPSNAEDENADGVAYGDYRYVTEQVCGIHGMEGVNAIAGKYYVSVRVQRSVEDMLD